MDTADTVEVVISQQESNGSQNDSTLPLKVENVNNQLPLIGDDTNLALNSTQLSKNALKKLKRQAGMKAKRQYQREQRRLRRKANKAAGFTFS